METKEDKKTKKPGLLNWLKPQKREGLTTGSDKSSGPKSTTSTPIESIPSYASPSECTSDAKQYPDVFLQQEEEDPLVKVTSNQEQLNQKNNERKGLEETITALNQLIYEKTNTSESLEIEVIKQLKQKIVNLTESNTRLQSENKALREENTYAKQLASAAATELTILTEEIMKLMNQNEKSSTESNNSPTTTGPTKNPRRKSASQLELLQREVVLSKEREIGYEAVLSERDEREYELEQMVMESKQREAYLENELANLWSVVSRVRNLEAVENEIDVEESSTESRSVGGVEV